MLRTDLKLRQNAVLRRLYMCISNIVHVMQRKLSCDEEKLAIARKQLKIKDNSHVIFTHLFAFLN